MAVGKSKNSYKIKEKTINWEGIMKHYCNPINISYKFQHYNNQASREAADPTLIYFKGKYYLFASMSAGFYYSEDLIDWKWHENRTLDMYRYAPDVRQVGEHMVFCASERNKKSTFYRTLDPLSDKWEKVSEPFAFWDPNVFCDDDGRVYFYWGCDCGQPIHAQEFDPETLLPIGKEKDVIFDAHDSHGFERQFYPGAEIQKKDFMGKLFEKLMALSGRKPDMPFIEGAFLNKWNGKYYLQYAAPATEVKTYGDGVYVGNSPMGTFTYQAHNPISIKPSGFITGAGHGSTIEDAYGNLWHASTMRISVNANFERRVGLFPAGLDKDGILFCNQNFADYPYQIPDGKFDAAALKPEWMLLSYKKKAKASSYIEGHEAELALNEDIRTSWCAKGSKGEWYELDLGDVYPVYAIQINFAEVNVPMLKKEKSKLSPTSTSRRYTDSSKSLKTRYLLEGSVDGKEWKVLEDKRQADSDLSHDYLRFEGEEIRFLRVTAVGLPYNENFALSGLRVFGKGQGDLPKAVAAPEAIRTSDMDARVKWGKISNAIGYNVRFGIAPDKLYNSYLVYEQTEVDITVLNKDQKYFVCVESFNEAGITEGAIVEIK